MHTCHMRRRVHACHLRRRIHADVTGQLGLSQILKCHHPRMFTVVVQRRCSLTILQQLFFPTVMLFLSKILWSLNDDLVL